MGACMTAGFKLLVHGSIFFSAWLWCQAIWCSQDFLLTPPRFSSEARTKPRLALPSQTKAVTSLTRHGAPKCMDRIKIQRNMFKQPHHGIARFFSCCPEGLTACPAPSCKRALATGFQHLVCSKINRKQPNPIKPLKQAPCASLLAENCTLMGATRLANEGLENSQLVEEQGVTKKAVSTIQLPNWGLSVTCESNLLWELESWFCLNGTTNMHHFCEFNGWPTCFFPAYWVSDLFHLRTTLIREYK